MKTIEIMPPAFSGAGCATVRLFEAGDLFFYSNLFKAQRIFVSELSNGLKLATASTCAIFKHIYQKYDMRRMDIFNGS